MLYLNGFEAQYKLVNFYARNQTTLENTFYYDCDLDLFKDGTNSGTNTGFDKN